MGRIRRHDPSRHHLHDYALTDPFTGSTIAAFSSQDEAMRYAAERLRGRLTMLHIDHPDGCACQPGQLAYRLEHEVQPSGSAN